MNELEEIDILKEAIRAVAEVLGTTVWVADRLPDADELASNMPAVVIDLLPGEETMPWGGDAGEPIFDSVALDVEVLAPSRADATQVGARVRKALHQLPHLEGTGVKSVECPRLSTREDLNPHIRVLGVVVEVMMSTHHR